MERHGHHDHQGHEGAAAATPPAGPEPAGPSVSTLAARATTHCLTGCAIGEVLGMSIAGVTGMATGPAVALSVALAFVFGYGLTMRPLLAAGTPFGGALRLALAADTISIVTMETVDNATVLLVPGAMEAGLGEPLFWAALAGGFGIAWLVTFPINRWLIGRGRGHAAVHGAH